MKVFEYEFPENRFYLKNHTWLKPNNGFIQVGLTELGQSFSREIVHIDLPEKGERIARGELLIAYETIKAVSQITLPFDSEVITVNEALWQRPNRINNNPYGEWMVEVSGELTGHMDAKEAVQYYKDLIVKEKERFSGY